VRSRLWPRWSGLGRHDRPAEPDPSLDNSKRNHIAADAAGPTMQLSRFEGSLMPQCARVFSCVSGWPGSPTAGGAGAGVAAGVHRSPPRGWAPCRPVVSCPPRWEIGCAARSPPIPGPPPRPGRGCCCTGTFIPDTCSPTAATRPTSVLTRGCRRGRLLPGAVVDAGPRLGNTGAGATGSENTSTPSPRDCPTSSSEPRAERRRAYRHRGGGRGPAGLLRRHHGTDVRAAPPHRDLVPRPRRRPVSAGRQRGELFAGDHAPVTARESGSDTTMPEAQIASNQGNADPGSIRRATGPPVVTEVPNDSPALERVEAELIAREPIFHRPELGTSREDHLSQTAEDYWEVAASGRVYDRRACSPRGAQSPATRTG